VICGVLWILYVLPTSPLQQLVAHSVLPDPWYLLGGLLVTYGIRYLVPGPAKHIVAALLCVAVVIGGFTSLRRSHLPSLSGRDNKKHLVTTTPPQGNVPTPPCPLKIYGLRSTPLEALTWQKKKHLLPCHFIWILAHFMWDSSPQKSMALAHTSTCLENC